MRAKKLLTYGALAAVGYMVFKHLHHAAAPSVAVIPAGAVPKVAGLGYFPDGSDRMYASRQAPGRYYRNWR